MRSTAPIKAAKAGYIIVSALLCVLGLVLIIFPSFSAEAFGVGAGIMMIVFGAVRLVGFFSHDLYRLAFQYDLPFGILLAALGVVFLLHPQSLVSLISISLGLYIMADGLFKIQIALEAKRFGIGQWWLIMVLALITGVLGLVLLLNPADGSRLIMILLGISLLSEGVLNFSTVITAVKIIKNQQPDSIDVEYEEK